MQAITTADWDNFIARQSANPANPYPPHLLQTSTWASFKGKFGWSAARVVAKKDGEIVAGAQILFRDAPLGLARIAYIPKGPVVDWQNAELVQYLLAQCAEVARAGRAVLLQIEPDLTELPPYWDSLQLRPSAHTLQPRQSIVLSLRNNRAEILAGMKQKTRYNVNLSYKRDITTRLGSSTDIPMFYQLLNETGNRDAFGIHSLAYYQAAYDLFAPTEQVALWLAEYTGQPLAGVLVFRLGQRAWYLYGASSNAERQRMPAYAAQWAAIEWAQAHGCTEYDLYGIPDYPLETLEAQFTDREDGLWPVYRFKRGWGGDLVRSVGSWEQVYSPIGLYALQLWRRWRGTPG
jgi:peptidoglycan pentaglycine glycine transferase (the first glycine)